MIRVIAVLLGALSATRLIADSPAYIVPVVTAQVKGRIYSTTLALRNDGQQDVACETIYAIPNDPKGGTLRATYTVPRGGRPHVEEDVLVEVGAVGTMRLVCSGTVAIAARIQSSTDGGTTFDEGRTYAALDEAAAFHRLRTLTAHSDLLVAEVAGKPVTFEATVKDDTGVVIGRKTYEVAAFAQQIVNVSTIREDVATPRVELRIVGGVGALVAGEETHDPAALRMAVRMTPETRRAFQQRQAHQRAAAQVATRGPSITEQLLICPFKAAPFRDPATGLCFLRDRWYDPSTGTFLTPDPEGYGDSSNLYIFGKGDPVNNYDPTGRTVALSGSAAEKRAAYTRLMRTIDNPAAARNITIDAFNRLQITGMTADDYLRTYTGRAGQLGQMILSPKTVFVSEFVRGDLEHPIAGARWPFPRTLEEKIERSGGGFFDPTFFGARRGLALFDPRKFPQQIAGVTETADAVFVHEFFGHAFSWAVPAAYSETTAGKINPKYVKRCDLCAGIGEGEAEGLAAENRYRLDHGMRLRTYYLEAEDDYISPAWLAPYITRQRQSDAVQRAIEAERRRREQFMHNIWEAPGKR